MQSFAATNPTANAPATIVAVVAPVLLSYAFNYALVSFLISFFGCSYWFLVVKNEKKFVLLRAS